MQQPLPSFPPLTAPLALLPQITLDSREVQVHPSDTLQEVLVSIADSFGVDRKSLVFLHEGRVLSGSSSCASLHVPCCHRRVFVIVPAVLVPVLLQDSQTAGGAHLCHSSRAHIFAVTAQWWVLAWQCCTHIGPPYVLCVPVCP